MRLVSGFSRSESRLGFWGLRKKEELDNLVKLETSSCSDKMGEMMEQRNYRNMKYYSIKRVAV